MGLHHHVIVHIFSNSNTLRSQDYHMFGEDPFDQEDTKNAGEITLRMPVCKLCEAPLKFDILMTNGPFVNM